MNSRIFHKSCSCQSRYDEVENRTHSVNNVFGINTFIVCACFNRWLSWFWGKVGIPISLTDAVTFSGFLSKKLIYASQTSKSNTNFIIQAVSSGRKLPFRLMMHPLFSFYVIFCCETWRGHFCFHTRISLPINSIIYLNCKGRFLISWRHKHFQN